MTDLPDHRPGLTMTSMTDIELHPENKDEIGQQADQNGIGKQAAPAGTTAPDETGPQADHDGTDPTATQDLDQPQET